jgi:hypothetical protein
MKDKPSDIDPVEVTLLLIGLAALVLLFPALIFHGRTDSGAWHWTTACTVGCAVWWGFLLTCLGGFIAGRVNSPAVRELEEQERLRRLPPALAEVPQPLRPDLRLMWVTPYLD